MEPTFNPKAWLLKDKILLAIMAVSAVILVFTILKMLFNGLLWATGMEAIHEQVVAASSSPLNFYLFAIAFFVSFVSLLVTFSRPFPHALLPLALILSGVVLLVYFVSQVDHKGLVIHPSVESLIYVAYLGAIVGIDYLTITFIPIKHVDNAATTAPKVVELPFWKRFYDTYPLIGASVFAIVGGYFMLDILELLGSSRPPYVVLLIFSTPFLFSVFHLMIRIRAARRDTSDNNRYVFLTKFQFTSYLDLPEVKRIGEFSLWEIAKIDTLVSEAKDGASGSDPHMAVLATNNLRSLCWRLLIDRGSSGAPDESSMPITLLSRVKEFTN